MRGANALEQQACMPSMGPLKAVFPTKTRSIVQSLPKAVETLEGRGILCEALEHGW